MRILRCLVTLAVLVTVACLSRPGHSAVSQKDEEEMGRKYAAQIEKDLKFVKDGPGPERVKRIGQSLAAIAREHEVPASYGCCDVFKFGYRFRVVEDKDVNAFSLPAGLIYVNTGLLEMVQSDDELAGVLAHEIAHAAHHHMSFILRKQARVDRYVALVALAGLLGNLRPRDLDHLVLGAQMLKAGKLSGYTQEAENDADRTAVAYLARSSYSPKGMLTFMQKLEAKHEENPTLPLGIYQTHPAPFRRVGSIAKAIEEEGVDVDLRELRNVAYARAVPAGDDPAHYQVLVGRRLIYEPASAPGASSQERAESAALRINSVLDAGAGAKDICVDTAGSCLLARGTQLLRVEPEDVAQAGTSKEALLGKASSALKYAVWADWLSASPHVVSAYE